MKFAPALKAFTFVTLGYCSADTMGENTAETTTTTRGMMMVTVFDMVGPPLRLTDYVFVG
jgi:hypothetical protein